MICLACQGAGIVNKDAVGQYERGNPDEAARLFVQADRMHENCEYRLSGGCDCQHKFGRTVVRDG